MNSGGFHTVFDASNSGYRYWWFPAIGLVFVGIGLAVPTLIRTGAFRKPAPWMEKWFPRFFLGFAIVWTSASFLATFVEYRTSVNALKANNAQVIEGPVTDFHPMPFSGHADESFVVNGVKFAYSDYVVTAGFNNTASHGGPIREGLVVRIWHFRGRILRLDVKDEPNQPPAANSRRGDQWRFKSPVTAAVADAGRWAKSAKSHAIDRSPGTA